MRKTITRAGRKTLAVTDLEDKFFISIWERESKREKACRKRRHGGMERERHGER